MFDVEKFRNYCLSKKGVTEHFPFDAYTLVFKVMDKMFALTGLDAEQFSINLKCDPELSFTLREKYPAVRPGYHMDKTHWNTVVVDGSIPQKEIMHMIDHSYEQVVKGLTRKKREELNNL